jgi:hypothetical protein
MQVRDTVYDLTKDATSQTFWHVVMLLQAFKEIAGGSPNKLRPRGRLDEGEGAFACRRCRSSNLPDLLDYSCRAENLG